MSIPTQITFRGVDSSDWVRHRVHEEADRLARFHSGIVRCRVMVEAPNQRQHHGRLYKVSIHLEIPGSNVAVSHRSPADHSQEDLRVAIREAFAAATRQLEDNLRQRRRDVKLHVPEPYGRVARLLAEKDCGFIETPAGDEVYFHANSVAGRGFAALKVGSEVRFVVEQGVQGLQASVVKPVGKHHSGP